jgi:hypothetical protein
MRLAGFVLQELDLTTTLALSPQSREMATAIAIGSLSDFAQPDTRSLKNLVVTDHRLPHEM